MLTKFHPETGTPFMSDRSIELAIGLVGDDHVLSLFNIQSDEDLKVKFQMVAPDEWKHEIKFKVKNYGVVGDCTSDLLEKMRGSFKEQVSALDYMILLVGTNDVLLGVPIAETVQNLRDILTLARKSETTPVFCTLLPISKGEFSQTVTDVNSMMTIFCAQHDFKVFDLNLSFNDGDDRLDEFHDIGDGVHLTQDGYLFLADNLLLRVVEIIGEEFEDYQNHAGLQAQQG